MGRERGRRDCGWREEGGTGDLVIYGGFLLWC